MVRDNLGLVGLFIKRNKPSGEDRDDVYQISCIALCKAVVYYKSKIGRFSTFAYLLIEREYWRFLENKRKVVGSGDSALAVDESCSHEKFNGTEGIHQEEDLKFIKLIMKKGTVTQRKIVKTILEIIKQGGPVSYRRIAEGTGMSHQWVHRQFLDLQRSAVLLRDQWEKTALEK